MTHSGIIGFIGTRSPLCALALLVMLSACSQRGAQHPPLPTMVQPVSNGQQLDDAIALLDAGSEKAARKMLRSMVKREPTDLRSAALLASLDADPQSTFGSKSFVYKVQPGDGMAGLSKRYLGDPLKFYLLARYNKIAVPASIRAGQMLRIPGIAPKIAPIVRETRPDPKADEPVVVAPLRPQRAPTAPTHDPRRADQLRGAGLAALNHGQVNRAVGLLRQAAAFAPDNAMIKRDLDRAQRLQATVRSRK